MLIIPVVLGFIYDWDLFPFYREISVSIFAATSIIHFILQLGFGYINWKNMKKIDVVGIHYNTAIQVTGWKEDRELFKRCLISISRQDHENIKYITFCSDGNEEEDEYMVEVFKEVFGNESYILRLENVLKEESDKKIIDMIPNLIDKKYICITQPHRGKRYAMYTQMILLTKLGVDAILFIDSDTIIKTDSMNVLSSTMEKYNADTVTGDVKIYNPENLLSFLIALKYWYAFNIERSCQSYFANVSCVAGPFGLYKTETISKIIEEWVNQKFWKKECTFGDDRHLTNLILKYGGKAYYTHRAACWTDSPLEMRRFISQQTRWGKSFAREYIINYQWFHRTTFWLFYDLSFMFIYSVILCIYLVELLLDFDLFQTMYFLSIILLVSFVKVLYAVLMTSKKKHIIFGLYSMIYLCILIPVKFWSTITINITKWGTGSRRIKTSRNIDLIPLFLWNGFLLFCVGYAVYNAIKDEEYEGFIVMGGNTIYLSCLYIYYCSIKDKYLIKVDNKLRRYWGTIEV